MLSKATPAPIRPAALLVAGLVLLTACGGGSTAPSADGGDKADGFPLTLKNCGRTVTVKAPPQRAVSVDQGSTEILLSLGLADRIAATATWSDPVMKGLEKANAGVERISDNRPSSEKVLDKEPDFLSASFASTLAKGGVAPREQFEKLGVPTYISPADCIGKDNSGGGDGARTEPLTMDSVYTEVRELAKVFGVPERGDALVEKLRGRVAKATDGIDASNASLLYWFSDSKAPTSRAAAAPPASSPANSARRTSSTTPTTNGPRSAGRPSPTATPTSWSSAT